MNCFNEHSFMDSLLLASTDNEIGERGATSLSDALKSNTTLTELSLGGEHKINNTKVTPINNSFFHSIKQTGKKIGDIGATSLNHALKSNTTLTKLDLGCEDKRNNTQMAFIDSAVLFHSHQINREQDWRHRNNIVE